MILKRLQMQKRLWMVGTSVVVVLVAALLFQACGPVNNKPADASGGDSGVQMMTKGQPQQAVGFSTKRDFVVAIHLMPAKTSSSSSSTTGVSALTSAAVPAFDAPTIQAQLGDNQYSINLRRGSDLGPTSDDLVISVEYEHTSTKIKMFYQAHLTAQPDGSFLADIPFAKGGVWKIHVHATDGDLDDDAVFQVKL
jgi:hypothetical protein